MSQDIMVPVPLPTEVPEPPRLDQIPLDILHSATVEMLIQQNEDLSSRLKVNIRRNSQLEQQILENKKQIQSLEQQRASLRAQNEIVREKESLWSSQKETLQRKLQSNKNEVELLEHRYNELFASQQGRAKAHQAQLLEKLSEISALQNKLKILHQVRRRAKEKLRHFILDMAVDFSRSRKGAKKTESAHRLLKKSFGDLRQEIDEKQNIFSNQLTELKKASALKIAELDHEVTALQEKNRLIEEQRQDLQSEIDRQQAQIHEEKKNRIKLAEALEQLDKLRNEHVKEQRLQKTHLDKLETALNLANQAHRKIEKENVHLTDKLEQKSLALSTCEKDLLHFNKENREISRQLESMKKLWLEAQDKLEKADLRIDGLERINRELSKSHSKTKADRSIAAAATPSKPQSKSAEILQQAYASQYRPIKDSPAEL